MLAAQLNPVWTFLLPYGELDVSKRSTVDARVLANEVSLAFASSWISSSFWKPLRHSQNMMRFPSMEDQEDTPIH